MSQPGPAEGAIGIPSPPGDQPGEARRPAGPALALRNWRVAWRLIALILIPVVMGLIFAGLRVEVAAGSAATFGRVGQLAVLGQQVTGLAQAMEDERDRTAAFIAAGRPPAGVAALRKQYAATDTWARKVAALARSIGPAFPAQTRAAAAAVTARITDLPDLRSYATGSKTPAMTVITDYSLATADLFAFNDEIAQEGGNSALVASVRALGALSRMKDQASQQRAILDVALLQGQFEPGALDALSAAQAQQASDLASFGTSATLSQSQALGNTVTGPLVDQAQAQEQQAIVAGDSGTPLAAGTGASQRWCAGMSYTIGRMRLVEQQLAASITAQAQAQALRRGAARSAVLTSAAAAALLVFVLLATWVIARSLVRPLRLLKAAALHIAGVRLPGEVRALSQVGGAGQVAEVEPIGVQSVDEIGQVARAFDQVHREAVRLAAEEATLRGSVSAMFVSLSRRSQSLLERQLRLIESLEQGEEDPERLRELFRMDHLATRMRRHSENLLVLAGHEAPRRWAEPVLLVDVVRAAVSEIEQYERPVLDVQPGISVTGNAVADTVHLLAELLENATVFSPKTSPVTVAGHALSSGGVLLGVTDTGMGMPADLLAQLNWRLENPPAADVASSRHMGLFAVAHLAARHGIRVRLQQPAAGGLTAQAWLPGTLISHDSGPAPWARGPASPAAPAVQALTRAGRFPRTSAAAAAEVFAARGAAPPVAVPESPQTPGPALPIFDSVESDWFRARGRRLSRPLAAPAALAVRGLGHHPAMTAGVPRNGSWNPRSAGSPPQAYRGAHPGPISSPAPPGSGQARWRARPRPRRPPAPGWAASSKARVAPRPRRPHPADPGPVTAYQRRLARRLKPGQRPAWSNTTPQRGAGR